MFPLLVSNIFYVHKQYVNLNSTAAVDGKKNCPLQHLIFYSKTLHRDFQSTYKLRFF